jgi:hypothetical protein
LLLSALIDQPQNSALRLQMMCAVYVALMRWESRLTLDAITISSGFDGSMVVDLTAHLFPFPFQQEHKVAAIDLSQLPPPQIVDVPDFETLLTEIGAAKLASAAALGVPLKITRMAVGDGGGVLPTLSAQQTALIAEKRRADLNMLYIDPQYSSQIIAEQVISETEGGWWIREVGLFDETGALIAIGNCRKVISHNWRKAADAGRRCAW